MNLIKLVVVFLLIFLYLFFSYIRFYHYIGDANLKSPFTQNSFILENGAGEGPAKYVALGDSLSAGVGSSSIEGTFVYMYASNLSEKYMTVETTNLAQPGGTTVDVINNQLPLALEVKPNYVTLLIGVNDIHNKRLNNDFREKYTYILKELITKTDASIVVVEIPYIGSSKLVYFPFNYLLNFRTKQFNKTIHEVVDTSADPAADTQRIKIAPIYKDTYMYSKKNSEYYSSDLFHPSKKGYALWGQIINEY